MREKRASSENKDDDGMGDEKAADMDMEAAAITVNVFAGGDRPTIIYSNQ